MFPISEEEKELYRKLHDELDKYMRIKYGDELMDELESDEKRMKEDMIKRFDKFAEVERPDKFMCWDCNKDIRLDDHKIIEHVKKTNLRTFDGAYLLVCKDCGEDE